MGWTFQQGTEGKSVRAYCDSILTWDNDQSTHKPLKSAMVGATYYAAVRTEYKDGKTAPTVWAAVFLTKRCPRARDGFTFGYKDMDETVGPNESECPPSILALLTPTESQWANEWRARCRENIGRKKRRPKVGDVIALAEPLTFSDGTKARIFQVGEYERRGKTRTIYRPAYGGEYIGKFGGYYLITKIERREFQIVPPAEVLEMLKKEFAKDEPVNG